jgi:hypothetical protein
MLVADVLHFHIQNHLEMAIVGLAYELKEFFVRPKCRIGFQEVVGKIVVVKARVKNRIDKNCRESKVLDVA